MLKKVLIVLFLITFIISNTTPITANLYKNDKIADVLIYSGFGAWKEGVTAFEKFLDFKGLSWFECDDTYIENNSLIGKFDVIHFPGGNSGYYIARINSTGLQNIRDFVSSGGGYIGICAGGYFACDRVDWEGNSYDHPLKLFIGVGYGAIDEIAPWPKYAMTTVNIDLTNPINQFEPSTEYTMYYGGAAYYPDEGQEMDIIATYDSFNDDPAMINFHYGDGRVVLIGPHPEIEEDSSRDDVVFADEENDLGTDWKLMWTTMDWLMGQPISEPPANSPANIPEISGNDKGDVGKEYEYIFNSSDPELEEIYFYIDWGDGQVEEWIGPFHSNDEINLSHIWTKADNYLIRAKAKDCNEAESNWEELKISMPKNKIRINSIFLKFLNLLINSFSTLIKIIQN
jgi:glutamine amidotransferase-like uncharacterized protein